MKKSIKGALLSGLVFPGVGQMVLNHYRRGIAWIIGVIGGLIIIIVKAEQIAVGILRKIESEGGAIDSKTISDAANTAVMSSDTQLIKIAFFFIIFCWIISIIDAYRIGKQMDQEETLT
jgi:TM2 domain-containing membrane protein YozV